MSERKSWRRIRRCPVQPCHKVSSDGDLRGRGGPLRPQLDEDGRRSVKLHGERVAVATVVLETFDRPRPYGREACHGPLGLVSDAVTNLRWGTHRENMNDKRRHEMRKMEGGTYPSPPRTESEADVQ